MTMSGVATFFRQRRGLACRVALAMFGIGALLPPPTAQAQQPTPGHIACAQPGQPLLRIPELVSHDGSLHGTIALSVETNRMKETNAASSVDCVLQFNRVYRGLHAILPQYPGTVPVGYPGYIASADKPPIAFTDTVPGPTLRARVGDLVELTFLNQVDPNVFGNSIDRVEHGQGCDESAGPYPYSDKYPDCFHGSSTGNVHFHGTHTNPSSTGDNVFIEVRPSLRIGGKPVVTEASVTPFFNEFFSKCQQELAKSQLSQWPNSWNDLPQGWVKQQLALLKQYDDDPTIKSKLLPVDLAQRAGAVGRCRHGDADGRRDGADGPGARHALVPLAQARPRPRSTSTTA
jgi:hypothetical protein